MSDEPIKVIAGKAGDPMFEAVFEMMEAMRQAVAPITNNFADPRDALSTIMTAAAMFSGVQAGTLMSIGALKQQDRRRAGEAALQNFRQGIDAGLKRGLRIGTEEFGGVA